MKTQFPKEAADQFIKRRLLKYQTTSILEFGDGGLSNLINTFLGWYIILDEESPQKEPWVYKESFYNTGFIPRSIDTVISLYGQINREDFLERPQLSDILNEVKRVLKKDGKFFIMLRGKNPNFTFPNYNPEGLTLMKYDRDSALKEFWKVGRLQVDKIYGLYYGSKLPKYVTDTFLGNCLEIENYFFSSGYLKTASFVIVEGTKL